MTRILVAIITVAMLSVVLVGTALGSVPITDMSSISGVANFLGAPHPLMEPATGAVAGVQGLPSTSTVADITGGLLALGIAAAAMALALVRRRSST
ncbi:MAG: hypothetical protein M3T56_17800 [Chloroflexota bacterium]|nr:hypothetical protein [Chloroflexota bacterium]